MKADDEGSPDVSGSPRESKDVLWRGVSYAGGATMPYFIKITERKTYLKYLIEAETAEDVDDQEETYLGYVEGDTEGSRVAGPFTSRDEALASDESHVEGA
jgi:hypothetical protein